MNLNLLMTIFLNKTDIQGLYLLTTGMPDQPMDVMTSYVEERCCHGNTKIHVVYLGLQSEVVGRNENTAECFRGLCRAAEGRLHWIRESGGKWFSRIQWFQNAIHVLFYFSRMDFLVWLCQFCCQGIIESDDVRLIEAEINRAIDYSQKCSALIESAKRKAPDLSQVFGFIYFCVNNL